MPSSKEPQNCRCDQGGHAQDLVQDPQAARALRSSLLAARASKESFWRGISVDALFSPGGGKMFGVMQANFQGQSVWRFAFSGQVDQRWEIPGWVGPVFDVRAWKSLEVRYDPEIKELTREIARQNDAQRRCELKAQRKRCSHALLDAYLDLYIMRALNGASAPIRALFSENRPPTGSGDCCAPKLVAAAQREGLKIQSLTEVFLGASSKSKERCCGDISVPCLPRCVPLLDFLLCPNAENL